MADPTPDSPESAVQDTFLSHLVELRSRLVHSIVAVLVVFVVLFPWSKEIYALLARPMLNALPSGAQMIATDVTGTFLVPLKVTLMAAFLIALPVRAVAGVGLRRPGALSQREAAGAAGDRILRRVLHDRNGVRVFLRVSGDVHVLRWLHAGGRDDDDRHREIPVFVLTMFVAFGITFEVPVVVVVLVRMRVVSLEKLRAIRPYVIVGAFVVGAIFTPPDVVSQLMLAVPAVAAVRTGARVRALRERASA
jgi:sec-independent protein translocase protein TatC